MKMESTLKKAEEKETMSLSSHDISETLSRFLVKWEMDTISWGVLTVDENNPQGNKEI